MRKVRRVPKIKMSANNERIHIHNKLRGKNQDRNNTNKIFITNCHLHHHITYNLTVISENSRNIKIYRSLVSKPIKPNRIKNWFQTKSLSTECWKSDPHLRPTFEQILLDLDLIAHSSFTQTPHESFHIMQDDWRQEIEEVLLELRRKEKVSLGLVITKASLFILCFSHWPLTLNIPGM